jgi:hypothetical protein
MERTADNESNLPLLSCWLCVVGASADVPSGNADDILMIIRLISYKKNELQQDLWPKYLLVSGMMH